MTNTNDWKTCTVYGPGSFLYRSAKTFRTDGTVYQVWEKRDVSCPDENDLLTWTQDAMKTAEGLFEPALSFNTSMVGGNEYSDAYAESDCYVSGWREPTKEELEEAKTLTFK